MFNSSGLGITNHSICSEGPTAFAVPSEHFEAVMDDVIRIRINIVRPHRKGGRNDEQELEIFRTGRSISP